MINLIKSNNDKVHEICSRHSVAELYLYGSAASGYFTENSDLDFAVVFKVSLDPIEQGDFFFGLKDDLEALFEKNIGLISFRALKNPIFIEEINNSKVSIYAV